MKCIHCKRSIDVKNDTDYIRGEHPEKGLHAACLDGYHRHIINQDRLLKLVKPLIDEVNAGNPADLAEAVVRALVTSHRTLQQSFIGAIKTAIEQYAGLDYDMYVDPRNHFAYTWAREVTRLCDSPAQMLPGRLPLV